MSRRLRYQLAIAALVAGIATLVASFVPFVWPRKDRPTRADAVVVLSGDYGERLALGQTMIRDGLASTLVLAGQPDTAAVDELCRARLAYEVVCVRPQPDSTRDEARATAELAAARGWRHLVVATTTAHVTRTRLLFRRCVKGDVDVVGAKAPYGLGTRVGVIFHEWLGLAYALTAKRAC